jgi:hypothetical protein
VKAQAQNGLVFEPFSAFIQRVRNSGAGDYVGRPNSRVVDATACEIMRQHVLELYLDVSVIKSFVFRS